VQFRRRTPVGFRYSLPTMDDRDAFFTQTIVGAPCTAFLGRRRRAALHDTNGLVVDLGTGADHLSDAWRDWLTLGRSADLSSRPRRRPGRVTRWMERHALLLALAGSANLCLGLLLMGLSRWP